MNSLLVLLGVAVALASVTALPTTSAPILQTAVAAVCEQVSANPAQAAIYYSEVLAVLNQNQNVEQYFPNTQAYLNNKTNKKEFLAGGQDCIDFFSGLEAALLADYQASGFSLQEAAAKVTAFIQTVIANIQATIQGRKK